MDLEEKIGQDFKAAMLARDELKLSVLRSLKSALTYASVDAKASGGDGKLTDEQVLVVLTKEAKKRQDSADAFTKGGANDRADKELTEKAIIEAYLPAALTDTELAQLVEQAIVALGASGPQDVGKVIGAVRAEAHGRVDGAKLAGIVKERLAS